jgi:hypothetical protein
VVKRSAGVAKEQRAHAPASDKAAAAQSAASGPSNEVASMAAGAQVGEMDAQEPQAFDRESFKAALLEKIAKTAPRNLKEADDFKDSGKLDAVKRDMTATVGEKKAQAQGNIAEATQAPPDPTGIEPKPVTPLEPTDAGPPPADLGAAAAAPKPKTDSEISLQEDSGSLDQKMQENEITEAQLENANEPAFQAAVDSKKTAQTDAQERPLAYRQEEQGIVAEAKVTAVGSAQTQLTAMHSTRSSLLEQVATGQVETKSQDELKRAEVANHIEAIYQRTKANVEARLARLDEEVNQAFDTGSAQAQQAFETHVETRMDAYKDERYSGLRGKGRWIRDKFRGLPNAVNVFYEEGRNLYLSIMDGVLNNIAIIVETGLNDAKAEIALGKQDVQTYVDSLPVDLQDVGQQAADKIQSQFDDLEQQVNDKQGELVDTLAKKYHDNLQKLDARIEEMKAANRGLIDKALGAIVGVIKTILALKNMLFNVLARAAAVIGTIISDPIGFLGNLVSGVMMGLENFMTNIGQHLKKGLMEWLFGTLGEAGIEMPDSFDFKGILSLVLQILGLTYANIRARAVNIVGEPVVKRIEQTVEIFKVLITEGPAGLWNMIQEQVGNLKDMVLDGIESFIKEKVLIAGITWIISLLNPASAFIKACKAIYDIVMFFVQRGSQILALVNAVLDSVTAIAQGSLGAAAAAVENALAKAIPVAIAFLASLLGLGGISEKIRTIIEKVRAPVNRAIDWIISKAVQLVKTVGKALGFGQKKEEETGAKPLVQGDIGTTIAFTADGEQHQLWIEIRGQQAVVMMASGGGKPVEEHLVQSTKLAEALQGGDRSEVQTEVVQAKQSNTELTTAANAAMSGNQSRTPSQDAGTKVVAAQQNTAQQIKDALDTAARKRFETFRQKSPYAPKPFSEPEAPKFAPIGNRETSYQVSSEHAWQREEYGAFLQSLGEMRSGSTLTNDLAVAVNQDRVSKVGDAGSHTYSIVEPPPGHSKVVVDLEDEAADADLKAAVQNAGGIVPFMDAIAKGQEFSIKNKVINRQELNRLWRTAANKTWLGGRFRAADPGKHEWIPTDLMLEVIARAAEDVPQGIETAKWIMLQHELRSDTSWVVFKPSKAKTETVEGQPFVVLQGHSGTLTYERDGRRIAATVGQADFHNDLRNAFRGKTVAGALAALEQVFQNWVWNGQEALPGNLNPTLQDSNQQSIVLNLASFKANQAQYYSNIQTMFATLKNKYK